MTRRRRTLTAIVALILASGTFSSTTGAQSNESGRKLSVLFLGDRGHHRPADRAKQLIPVLARRGIEIEYTEKVGDLNPQTLSKYDCLMVYANIGKISPDQEKALLDYVAGGKGFVPLHCASYCFLNSPKYIELVGAQFKSHKTGQFRTTIVESEHPILKGFAGFESWDETYVHHRHNEKDRTVLSYREEGEGREPWTWVRTHGKGRVFYTAWGHDHRTWGHAGFQNLVERGLRWASGGDPTVAGAYAADAPFPVPVMTAKRTDVRPFEYVPAKVPNYPPSRQWGVQLEPLTQMQSPVEPTESMKHIVVPRGFHVELFASEPDIGGKPICMSWDERGRLWIGETYDYPNELRPPGEGRDRIRICEDTDRDGKADKFTVFVEKLSIPASITFWRGGVIVHTDRQTLYLKDTDGDGRSDSQKVLFSGWNMRDTHGGASNLHYGHDNWIWGMQGYNRSSLEVEGETVQFSQGFYRFRPDGSKMEFLRSTNNNTWGIGFSEEGIVFGSTANRNPSVYMPIPNRYYEAVRGWSSSVLGTIADTHRFKPITDKVRQVDQHGGYTAGAGHALYTARHYPREYWNRTAFVNGPTGHLVGTFVLKADGSDFKSSNPFNLLASDDEWTAPIMAEVGPDGNVWVIDWYNYIVQHNPTPRGFRTGRGAAYETELRDKKHGRIYRVIYDKAPAHEPMDLSSASPQELVATLKHSNMFWRKQAQRLLVERGEKDTNTVAGLIALVRNTSTDAIGLNTAAIHALWTLHGLGALDGENASADAAAVGALKHPSAGARRNAVAVLARTQASTAAILAAGLLDDPSAQVRLAALLALSEMPANEKAGRAIATALADPRNMNDRWFPDAATSAAARHDIHFLQAVTGVERPSQALLRTVGIVAEHYARGAPANSVGALLSSLGESAPAIASPIVRGLADGWPAKSPAKLAAADEEKLVALLSRLETGSRGLLIKLVTSWGSESLGKYAAAIVDELSAAIADASKSDERRIQAARELIEFQPRSDAAAEEILGLITPRTPPALAKGLIESLQASEAKSSGSLLVGRLGDFTPSAREVATRVLLGRNEKTLALLDAVEKGDAQLTDLSLDQRQALSRHPDRRIARRARKILERGGGLPNPDRLKVLETLASVAERKGDAAQGKLVFEKHCSPCHRHGSLGKNIGPDLTGMAVHPKSELLTQIIDPSASVEGNYRVYSVVAKDGRVINGLLASETRTSVEIINTEGKNETMLREDILRLVRSTKSLMPDGFESQMSRDELSNLLEFLTQRGKFLPIPLEKVATIVSTRGMFNSKDSRGERMVFSDWSPKTFEGIPFHLVDPQGDRKPNVILLNGPQGRIPPQMPRSVTLPCNSPARAIHFLSGVSGWGHPLGTKGSVTMIVRLHYEDGETEDHPLKNGEHFADYIRHIDVPKSKLAYRLRGQQIRYLALHPNRHAVIREIELVKGQDATAPIVMAVTVEAP